MVPKRQSLVQNIIAMGNSLRNLALTSRSDADVKYDPENVAQMLVLNIKVIIKSIALANFPTCSVSYFHSRSTCMVA